MSLRVALVDHPDQHGDLRRLAAELPREWVVIDGLRPEQLLEDAALGGIDAVFTSADPGAIDGATLLQRLQRVCPEALRVLVLPVLALFGIRLANKLVFMTTIEETFGISRGRSLFAIASLALIFVVMAWSRPTGDEPHKP